MTEDKPVSSAPAKPRRRLTHEERIEQRKKEIEQIEAKRREKVTTLLEKARAMLNEAHVLAMECGMDDAAKACATARTHLNDVLES